MENNNQNPPEWITDPQDQERWYEGRDDKRSKRVNAGTIALLLDGPEASCAYEHGYVRGQ